MIKRIASLTHWPAPVQFPQLALDISDVNVLTRLGAFPNRIGSGYKPTTDPDFEAWFAKQTDKLEAFKNAKLPVTVEIGGGAFCTPEQPLGRPRPHPDEHGVMLATKFDLAWPALKTACLTPRAA